MINYKCLKRGVHKNILRNDIDSIDPRNFVKYTGHTIRYNTRIVKEDITMG
jgi:hypothetical protein